MKAVTNILHNGKTIEAGSTVTGIDKEELALLKQSGAVVEDKDYSALTGAEKEAKIAELKSQLADLGVEIGVASAAPTAPTPGDVGEQLTRDGAIAKLVAEGKSQAEATKIVDEQAKKAASQTK